MKTFRYTLIEILAVIAIASILFAIAIPAFTRVMKGTASTQAARELMGRIHAARSYAIAKNSPVAIVFFGYEAPSGSTPSENYAYSAYRVCNVKYDYSTSLWVFQSWVSEWYFLPKGIVIGLPGEMNNPASGEGFTNPYAGAADATTKDTDSRLIRQANVTNMEDAAVTDETTTAFEIIKNKKLCDAGNSPVFNCDVSDLYGANDTVNFRNAIVFNSNGMMEKPRNLVIDDSGNSLKADTAVIIPLREALIDGTTVTPLHDDLKEFVPVRVEPSGKTSFYDGYCKYP